MSVVAAQVEIQIRHKLGPKYINKALTDYQHLCA